MSTSDTVGKAGAHDDAFDNFAAPQLAGLGGLRFQEGPHIHFFFGCCG
ncbi:MAG: hypothetical protein U5Q44_13710 [Dehalococcoidia bacterium]|nr:hypothetical protein [Dehalococcoidia bacterium]